ncbi:MAG: hypothetical protein M3453_07445 [Pseudomonadota bacterium]|nr:hypothetical protein [Pseudomonadota bacterium]
MMMSSPPLPLIVSLPLKPKMVSSFSVPLNAVLVSALSLLFVPVIVAIAVPALLSSCETARRFPGSRIDDARDHSVPGARRIAI